VAVKHCPCVDQCGTVDNKSMDTLTYFSELRRNFDWSGCSFGPSAS
jgi:hypothetical protein